jgi:hypothetical protein
MVSEVGCCWQRSRGEDALRVIKPQPSTLESHIALDTRHQGVRPVAAFSFRTEVARLDVRGTEEGSRQFNATQITCPLITEDELAAKPALLDTTFRLVVVSRQG